MMGGLLSWGPLLLRGWGWAQRVPPGYMRDEPALSQSCAPHLQLQSVRTIPMQTEQVAAMVPVDYGKGFCNGLPSSLAWLVS